MTDKKKKNVNDNELVQEYIEQTENNDTHFYSEFTHSEGSDGGCCC